MKILSVLPPDSASLLCAGLSVSSTVCAHSLSVSGTVCAHSLSVSSTVCAHSLSVSSKVSKYFTSTEARWPISPVLNWANCLFAENTSDSSTNYNSFLN